MGGGCWKVLIGSLFEALMANDTGKSNRQSAMTASSSRPLRMHARRDLEVQLQSYQGRDYWVVKDPISLKFYRFEEEEWALLQMMDGCHSPDQIKLQFDYQFAPQKITLQELYQFSGMLHRSSLLVSELPNQGTELRKRGLKNRRNQWKQSLSNVMAIRFKGFDPDRLLGGLDQWLGWLFTFLGLAAGGLIFTQFELFQAKLPTFQDFFAAKNWIWLALVLGLTKIAHEFGHGLACKRFGSQCHEMGFMLLVFTPCLYVNVSDSWLLPSKWKRIAISAAGMYVELILASLAVFVWWFSHPGLINQLALNVIFVCSVSTLIINANPLLRYDGYYILSDLLEIPNLRSKATSVLQRTSGSWMLGIESRHDPFLPTRGKWLFISYSIAAVIYRWFITLAIFWFVYRVLEPYGFKIVGQLLAMFVIYGLLVHPLIRLYKYFSIPGRLSTVKPVRFAISACLLSAILIGVLLVPIPHYVHCSLYVQPANVANVYVDEEGILETIYVSANTYVEAGQPILGLSSYKLKVQLASLQTQLDLAKVEEQNVMAALAVDTNASNRVSHMRAAVLSAEQHLQKRKRDSERLTIRAPQSGILIAPPRVAKKKSESGELGTWTDTPLSPKNLGAVLERQTLVGQIIPDPTKMEAVLAIDQADIEFVQTGQRVEIVLHQIPAELHHSTVQSISSSKMKAVPKSLSSRHGGDIVVVVDKDGIEVPQSTTFLVKVPLSNPGQIILSGSTGVSRIRTGSQTLAVRMWRMLSQTFQFEL
jgi:putative peptide zinc metalloprotease protein